MGLFRKLFGMRPAEQWRLVTTIEEKVSFTQTRNERVVNEKVAELYYHLFESDRGKRKVDFGSNLSDEELRGLDLEKRAMAFDIYQKKIYRWLNGRRDPGIPTYSDVDAEDTFNMLKGKI